MGKGLIGAVLLLGIFILMAGSVDAIVYANQSDGFSLSVLSIQTLGGMAKNGSDFWIVDHTFLENSVTHLDRNGNNQSDAFLVSAGCTSPTGITTNGSDFWIVDNVDKFVYHYNQAGVNQTDGFHTNIAGANAVSLSITTNVSGGGKATDFWIIEWNTEDFVYHFNRTGGNMTSAGPVTDINAIGEPGFSTAAAGADNPNMGIVTNNSDFWILDGTDLFVYHFDRNGNNQSDGFSVSVAGISDSRLAINVTSGTPTDFWMSDSVDNFMYHFANDTINPDINITNPAQNNTNTSNINIEVNYTRSDNGFISSCWYSNDTYSINITLASCGNITTVTWSQGKHNVTIYVNDTNNNLNFSTISFTIDSVAPNLNITNPTANNTITNNTNYDVNFTFSDSGIGIDSIWYSNDTYTINRSLGSGGTYTNLSNITWSEGKHNVTIYVNDTAGNLNFSTISFTVDITKPDINITYPINNTNSNNANLNVNFTFSDLVGIDSVWYSNDTYSVNLSLGSGGTYFNITNITWSEGKHNVTVYVNDSANNLNWSTISFTVDTTAPTVTFSCSPSSVNAGDIVTCSCSGSDSLSGVQTTSYTANPPTTSTGTFSEICTVTDFAGNQGKATTSYIVEGGGFTGGGSGGGGSEKTSTIGEPISEKTYLITSISPETTTIITSTDSQNTFI